MLHINTETHNFFSNHRVNLNKQLYFTKSNSGAQCRYSGSVTPTTTSPYFSPGCSAVTCPQFSTGMVPSGCICNTGYRGTIAPTSALPFYSGGCSPSPCDASSSAPINGALGSCSGLTALASGSSCQPTCVVYGYAASGATTCSLGVLTKASCNQVNCPLNAAGAPSCTCNAGFSTTGNPSSNALAFYFEKYTDTCSAVPCAAVTHASPSGSIVGDCSCNAGYSESQPAILASKTAPFFTGSCSAVPCAAVPNAVASGNVADNCVCNGGYTETTIIATTISPFFSGACQPSPCDASSSAPINGAIGTCSGQTALASGSSCQPTCANGYAASGATTCSLGALTKALCNQVNCPLNAAGAPSCSCNAGYSTTGNPISNALAFTAGQYVANCSVHPQP